MTKTNKKKFRFDLSIGVVIGVIVVVAVIAAVIVITGVAVASVVVAILVAIVVAVIAAILVVAVTTIVIPARSNGAASEQSGKNRKDEQGFHIGSRFERDSVDGTPFVAVENASDDRGTHSHDLSIRRRTCQCGGIHKGRTCPFLRCLAAAR